MNNREKAWLNRKGDKTPETIYDRMKKMKFNNHLSKKGIAERETFAKKYGRAWWLFTDNNSSENIKINGFINIGKWRKTVMNDEVAAIFRPITKKLYPKTLKQKPKK